MKLLCTALVSGTMLCLSLVPPAFAGPGGTYGTGGYGMSSTYPSNNYGPYNGYGPQAYPRTNTYTPNSNNFRYDDDDDYHGGGFNGGFSPAKSGVYRPNPIGVTTPRTNPTRPYYDRRTDDFQNPNNNTDLVRHNDHFHMVHRPNYYDSGWYHGDWSTRNRTSKNNPYAWGGWNWGKGKPSANYVSAPWQYGYWSYSNPYYNRNARGPAYINYAQPIVASNITVDGSGFAPQAVGQVSRREALQIFTTARAAFFAGDLNAAQQQVEQAIAALPGDTVLHEFRALVLFARRDYSSAAGALYAVLSSGPGWDWTTMIGLYPNADIYTGQLRNLENFCNANPGAANARFVLAYHYLTAGYTDAASEMYRQVLTTNPRDTLSAQLLGTLTGVAYNPGGQQVVDLRPTNQSVDIRYLLGHWQAIRQDGSQFQLDLDRDGTYDWRFSQGGRTQQFNGTYTIADSVLVLQQNGQPAMVGQVIPLAGNRFVFKLTGGDPSDPGLNFVR